MRKQHQPLRLATGAAVVLAALAAASLTALPAAAASGVEIEESGDVKVRVDTNGKWFDEGTEYVEINGDIGSSEEFVLSWERPDLQWQSPEELEDYITGDYDMYMECQMDHAREFVQDEGVKSWDEFKARWGIGDSWDFTADEWADIESNCGEKLWDLNAGTLDWTGDTTFMARVPVSLLGSGEVEVFIQPLRGDSVDSSGNPLPECIIADYPSDTVWSNCHYVTDGSAATSTINIVGSTQAPVEPTQEPTTEPSEDVEETEAPVATDEPEEASGFPMWLLFVIIGGVVLIGVIVTLLLVMGRKNKAPAQVGYDQYGAQPGYADPNAYGQQPQGYADPNAYGQQPHGYGAQSTSPQQYGQQAPTQAYGAPQANPSQQYGQQAPTQAYGAPQQDAPQQYGQQAPTQAYGAPQPYGQQAPGASTPQPAPSAPEYPSAPPQAPVAPEAPPAPGTPEAPQAPGQQQPPQFPGAQQ